MKDRSEVELMQAMAAVADEPLQPHEDESLPPQLREALRIMARRGPVVELTSTAMPKARKDDTEETP